jgi:hypothetical protein
MTFIAGPVELSTFDIAMIVLAAAAPAILLATGVAIYLARRREPGRRLWFGVGVGILAFLVIVALEGALSGAF